MKSVIFLLIFGVSFAALAFGQTPEGEIEVSGQVISAETKEPIPFVHIVNQSTNQGTTTNAEGEFKIYMEGLDTLVFSSMGFDQYRFTLKNQPPGDKLFVKIALNTSTLELQPVEIFAFRDAESFKEAILDLDIPEDNEPIYIPGAYNGPKRDVKATVLNPMSFVFSKFSKKEKEKRMLAQAVKDTKHLSRLRAKFDFIKEIAELEDQELNEFLEFCKLSHDRIDAATEYEIALAVNLCLVEFKESKK